MMMWRNRLIWFTIACFGGFLIDQVNSLSPQHVRGSQIDIRKDSTVYTFDYLYNEGGSGATHVMLIPPLGVGIGRWYYDRLLQQFLDRDNEEFTFVAPDLLGSGSASGVVGKINSTVVVSEKLPLLTVNDWATQIVGLMKSFDKAEKWSIVSNGGCIPIALAAACDCMRQNVPVSNIVLSSPPSLKGLLRSSDEEKTRKSYRTLTGIVGKVFWWYSLRREGRFIQSFSEKNLAANSSTLGSNWRCNCVATCINYPQSKYSTFSFLAGGLRCNCTKFFETLKGKVKIDVISGIDKRRNSAKSWFWEKQKKRQPHAVQFTNGEQLSTFLKEQETGGGLCFTKGRICLAHEDAPGYAACLREFHSAP